MRVLPREKESMNEMWLSDRDRFSYEGLNHADRLTQPRIKQEGKWVATDWTSALQIATDKLGAVFAQDPLSVGALVSPNATVEECFILQKLMREKDLRISIIVYVKSIRLMKIKCAYFRI